MPTLKQGTLSFASAKRTNSSSNGKKVPVTEKAKNKRVETSTTAEVQNNAKLSDVLEVSEEEGVAPREVTIPSKRIRASTKTRSPSGTVKQALVQPSESEEHRQGPSPVVIEGERLDVDDKAGRYRKYYNEVRSKTGYTQPSTYARLLSQYRGKGKLVPFASIVHSEGQNRIHQMLRFFDLSYEFGPCIGMTRLERWERAEALGLKPPVEVRDILLKEGVEKGEYTQCVLDGEV